MAQAVLRHILLGLATSGLLMGCVQGGDTATPAAPGTSGTARATATGDVEAPEVFQATDSALWDGRPSLGGIWVASADVKDPERVVMFNPANGKTVQGALFRRERDNPGPRLQISSDAAEALGILAGQPVEIRVTALRRIEAVAAAEVATPAVEAAATGAGTAAAPATDAEGTVVESDAAATAAAATAALAATGAAVADGAVAAVDAAAPDATVTEPPKRKTWKERRAEAKAAREAKKAAAAAAAAGELADGATGSAADEVAATANAVTGATIESAPLDARSADAAAAPATDAAAAPEVAAEPVVVAPPKTRRQLRAEEAAAKAAAATAATETLPEAPAEAAPAAAAPAGRLIQVASFAKEANADRAVEALAKAGISGQTRKSEANGKIVWGVVTTGDEAQLTAIKGFGFADAFFLQ